MATIIPPSKCISLAFSKGARTYDHNASAQREVLEKLAAKILKGNWEQPWIDLGCGTGLLEAILEKAHKQVPIVCVDLALESLKVLKKQYQRHGLCTIQADIDCLPFKSQRFPLVVMSSVMQWLPDPLNSISGVSSLLKPGGPFFFSAFCKGTFRELFTLRADKGLPIPVHLFSDSLLISTLQKAGLTLYESEVYEKTSYFTSAWEVLKNISALGGSAVTGHRLSRIQLLSFCKEYEHQFGTRRGIPVSYVITLGAAKKGNAP